MTSTKNHDVENPGGWEQGDSSLTKSVLSGSVPRTTSPSGSGTSGSSNTTNEHHDPSMFRRAVQDTTNSNFHDESADWTREYDATAAVHNHERWLHKCRVGWLSACLAMDVVMASLLTSIIVLERPQQTRTSHIGCLSLAVVLYLRCVGGGLALAFRNQSSSSACWVLHWINAHASMLLLFVNGGLCVAYPLVMWWYPHAISNWVLSEQLPVTVTQWLVHHIGQLWLVPFCGLFWECSRWCLSRSASHRHRRNNDSMLNERLLNVRDEGSVDFASVQEEWASRAEDDPFWWSRDEDEIQTDLLLHTTNNTDWANEDTEDAPRGEDSSEWPRTNNSVSR